jgi:two-component system, LuxR family, response regulator FixJ
MVGRSNYNIYIVDDDAILLKAVAGTLSQTYSHLSCFSCAAKCLEQLRTKKCDLIITDLKMPEMNGIELLIRAKKQAPWMPVLVVTGYGDIPTAITAVKAGAADFIEKPFEREFLLEKVKSVLQNSYKPDIKLTKTERKVLELVTTGKRSKEIAIILNRSSRTIEFHRTNIMAKFRVNNVVELTKRAIAMGLVKLE